MPPKWFLLDSENHFNVPTRPRGSYARMSVRRLLTSDWQTHRGVYPELEWVVGKAEIPGEAARRTAPSLPFVLIPPEV